MSSDIIIVIPNLFPLLHPSFFLLLLIFPTLLHISLYISRLSGFCELTIKGPCFLKSSAIIITLQLRYQLLALLCLNLFC